MRNRPNHRRGILGQRAILGQTTFLSAGMRKTMRMVWFAGAKGRIHSEQFVRLLIILLGLCGFSTPAHSQVVDVHLNYENQTISHILNDLEESYGLVFTFGKIPLERATSFQYHGKLDQALATFLSDNDIITKKNSQRQNGLIPFINYRIEF